MIAPDLHLSDLGQAALDLAREGACVFPLLPRDKRPWAANLGEGHCTKCRFKHARGLLDATMAPEVIAEWWTNHPEANIGLPTGKRSGVFAIDVDPRHDGLASWSRLVNQLGPVPETLLARTRSGGWHYLFALPKHRAISNSSSKLAPGIDVRGENGYIVAAPSVVEDPKDGVVGTYEWIKRVAPAEIPEAWLAAIPEKREKPHKNDYGQGMTFSDHLRRLAALPEAAPEVQEKAKAHVRELIEKVRHAEPGQSFNTTSAAALALGRYIARRQITGLDTVDAFEAMWDACNERNGCDPDHVVGGCILYGIEDTEVSFAEAAAGIGSPNDIGIARLLQKKFAEYAVASAAKPRTQRQKIAEANAEAARQRIEQASLKEVTLSEEISRHEAVLNDPSATPQAKAAAKAALTAPRTSAANLYAERETVRKEKGQDQRALPKLEVEEKAAEAEAEAEAKARAAAEPSERQKALEAARERADAATATLSKMKAAKSSTIRGALNERLSKGIPAGQTKESIETQVRAEVDDEIRAQQARVDQARAEVKAAEEAFEEEQHERGELVLARNDKGIPIVCDANIWRVLRNDEKARFRTLKYDVFGDRIMLHDVSLEEHDLFDLNVQIQDDYGLNAGAGQFTSAVLMFAKKERSYHPVKDYMSGLPAWDGEPRLLDLARLGFGARNPYYETPDGLAETEEDEELAQELDHYHGIAGIKMMIGAVARIMTPNTLHGEKMDTVLTLISPQQGRFKSTALQALCPDRSWFSDTPLDLASKDKYIALNGVFIYEWAEIDGMNKHDSSEVKRFFSSQTDKYRPPYARGLVTRVRQTVTVASLNKMEFINDTSGGRRFVPILVGTANPDWITQNRDQLWAEALYLYRMHQQEPKNKRFNWWFEGDEHKLLQKMVEPHLIETSLDVAVKEWLAAPMFVPGPAPAVETLPNGQKPTGLFAGMGNVGVSLVPYEKIAKDPSKGLHFTIKEIEAALNMNELLKGSRGVDRKRIKEVLVRLGWEGPFGDRKKWSPARGASSKWWMPARP